MQCRPFTPWLQWICSPWERMSSAVVDMLILSPLVGLVAAPFDRQISEAFLQGQEHPSVWVVGKVVSAAVVIWLYFALSWFLYGRTLGQRVWGLIVISDSSGQKPDWETSALRALGFLASCMMLGLPMLSLWIHARRKTVYDKWTETSVVGGTYPAPVLRERRWARILQGAGAGFVILFGWVLAQEDPRAQVSGSCDLTVPWERARLLERPVDRMDLALALWSVEAISSSCLQKTSELHRGPWAMAARALTSTGALATQYRKAACSASAEVCHALSDFDSTAGITRATLKRKHEVRSSSVFQNVLHLQLALRAAGAPEHRAWAHQLLKVAPLQEIPRTPEFHPLVLEARLHLATLAGDSREIARVTDETLWHSQNLVHVNVLNSVCSGDRALGSEGLAKGCRVLSRRLMQTPRTMWPDHVQPLLAKLRKESGGTARAPASHKGKAP